VTLRTRIEPETNGDISRSFPFFAKKKYVRAQFEKLLIKMNEKNNKSSCNIKGDVEILFYLSQGGLSFLSIALTYAVSLGKGFTDFPVLVVWR